MDSDIASRINEMCIARGLWTTFDSIRSFAKHYDLDNAKLGAWLAGRHPDANGLRALERAFGAPAEWYLVSETGATKIIKWWESGKAMILKARASPELREQTRRLSARRK